MRKRQKELFPEVYGQFIYKRDGTLWGVEILTRNFCVNEKSDVFLFYFSLESILEYWELFKKNNLKVHLNVFPSSVGIIPFFRFPKEITEVLMVEIVEKDLHQYLDDVLALKESGIKVVLDDFGNGSSNFFCIRFFETIKVDGQIVNNLPEIIPLLKQYGVKQVIVEKSSNFSIPADGFQSFDLHVPEPIEKVVERLKKG